MSILQDAIAEHLLCIKYVPCNENLAWIALENWFLVILDATFSLAIELIEAVLEKNKCAEE